MDSLGIKQSIDNMDINDIVELRKIASNKIKNIRKTNTIKIQTFVPATKHAALKRAQKWAFEQGLIEKDTTYGFAKFSIMNTIDLIMQRIANEEIKKKNIVESSHIPIQPDIPNMQPKQNYPIQHTVDHM